MSNVAPTETRNIEIAATVVHWDVIEAAAEDANMTVDMYCAAAVVDAAVRAVDGTRTLTDEDIAAALEPFADMLSEWKDGKPVTKICYSLGNNHMEALDTLLNHK